MAQSTAAELTAKIAQQVVAVQDLTVVGSTGMTCRRGGEGREEGREEDRGGKRIGEGRGEGREEERGGKRRGEIVQRGVEKYQHQQGSGSNGGGYEGWSRSPQCGHKVCPPHLP